MMKLYTCNLCNWNGSEFLKRDASLVCPRCFSRQRHRSIYHYLTLNKMTEGNACLDVASRRIFQHRLSYSDYITIDKIPGYADHTMDVCDLKFSDNRFDLIICCSVLQFVNNYQSALLEMYRVLKPTGTCIIQIPYDPTADKTYLLNIENTSIHCGPYATNHQVCFSYPDILQQLQQNFEVKTYLYNETAFEFSQQNIFVCQKILAI
jgi:predicted SAM-dependent methyltransferase